MDYMLDTIYGSTGVDPKILASVSAMFDQFSKLEAEIGTRRTTSWKHYMEKEHTGTNLEHHVHSCTVRDMMPAFFQNEPSLYVHSWRQNTSLSKLIIEQSQTRLLMLIVNISMLCKYWTRDSVHDQTSSCIGSSYYRLCCWQATWQHFCSTFIFKLLNTC